MEPTIIFDNVSKKFSRSYVSDSLRDTIAAPFKRMFGKDNGDKKNNKAFWALKDVSLQVKPGEALGIIGTNGSGKSTTLKLLSRILRPDSGSIQVIGRIGALIELGAGFSPDLTGRENVFLNASILGMSKDEIIRKYEDIVKFAELEEFMDTPVKWYSSGMHARLGFSVAAHTDPQVLLVDEVLSVGDAGFQRKCLDAMRAFKDRGITIVFVSHNMQSVTNLCDRALLLNRGRVILEGAVDAVVTHYLQSFIDVTAGSDSQPVRLESGSLSNISDTESSSFYAGESAKVRVKLFFDEDFDNIDVGISVRKTNGLFVFKTELFSLHGQTITVKKGQSLAFSLSLVMNLAPSEYYMGVYVFNRANKNVLLRNEFSQFVIEKNTRYEGIAYLEPKINDQLIING